MLPDLNTCQFKEAEEVASFAGTVVDVRTPEAFAEGHLPGSVNHCVYEVAFTEAFPQAFPDRDADLLIYGDGDPYKADLAALGRLRALGYSRVYLLRGGLSQWQAAGNAVEGIGPQPTTRPAGQLNLDAARTRVRWVGRNLINQHDGEVKAVRGWLELDDAGTPAAGEVVVDLKQLTCRDLEDPGLAGALIGHLQNADFFDVTNFPEASFTLTSATPIPDASYGQPNFTVNGTMTARGKTLPLTITALVEPIEGGYVFQSNFSFDRVTLGACYGSGRLFERLGMHLVNDLVSIDVTAFFQS